MRDSSYYDEDNWLKAFMLVYWLFFLFLLGSPPLYGQVINLDSLYVIWQDQNQPDSTRAIAYHEYIKESSNTINPDSSLVLINELIEFSKLHDFREGYNLGLSRKCWAYFNLGKYNLALDIAELLLKNYQESDEKTKIAWSYNRLGTIYNRLGSHSMALKCYLKSLKILENLKDKKGIASLINNIGNLYTGQKDYPMAMDYYKRSLKIAEEIRDTHNIVLALKNISWNFSHQKLYEEAQGNNLRILRIYEKLKNKEGIAITYGRIGSIYLEQDLFVKALDFHERSLNINKKLNNRYGIALDFDNIGNVYFEKGDYNKARYYHNQSLEIREELGDKPQIIWSLNKKGTAYLKLGNYDEALNMCKRSFSICEELNQLAEMYSACDCLYKSYKAIGKNNEALAYLEKRNEINDTLKREETSRLLQKMEFDEQAFVSELQYQQSISDEKLKKNIFLLLGIIALLLTIGLFTRLHYVRKTEAILKEKNQQVEAEKEKAKASEKAKQQFLANMSHEIRTPMNAIKGMTDILLRRTPQSEQLSYLNAIKESSNSLLVIINDILDISKIEAGKIDLEEIPFSLKEVVDNVNMIMNFKVEEKGLLLKMDMKEGIADKVIGDPTRLHQILLNLTGNAIKFTEKGMVTIQLKTEEFDDGKMMANFCVSDTGVGIGKDHLEKIFETFEQAYSDTMRKFGGTGLGLSISKKLVEIQGGKIWAESKKGKGSQFYFTIPFKVDTQQESTIPEEQTSNDENIAAQLKGIKVLLVEDNQFNAIVAQEELEDAIEEVEVEIAENGVIAIEKVAHGDYDIILMDVQMPVMNGYEATHAIRNLSNGKANTPIIAMTANVMKEEIERCYEAGMDDFIGKPFDTEELLKKIYLLKK